MGGGADSELAKAERALPSPPVLTVAKSFAIPARLLTLVVGFSAITWGVNVLPVFLRQAPIERMASYIVDRASFKPDVLVSFLPSITAVEKGASCRSVALHSAAIMRLRLAEDALATGARVDIDPRLDALHDAIHRSLACTPADPFLWMVLAWVDGTRNGFQQEQLTFLRLSYRLGANEGWIAARRSRFALPMFGQLPPDLANSAVHEFARMVDSWIYWDTIAIFTGPGWPIHERLLAALGSVGLRQREAFYVALYTQGYKVVVPGVTPRDPRPWY